MSRTRVMIVEDEIIVAKSYKYVLEILGYSICCIAFSGEEAIESAETEKPDVILMDIAVKGKMDGIEAGNQIKALYGIPVIYLTGYDDAELRERAGVTHRLEYLVKPVEPPTIGKAIEWILKNRKLA